ncbi:MAG: MBL fold metallo-hydrolase [Cellulosilyticaceae bacterium]
MASISKISAGEIFNKIIHKENLFIIDVRNNSEYDDWKIEGKTIESINRPYFDLLDGVEELVEEIPKDKEIIVVCAKEGSSKFIAEMLVAENVDVKYLSGGMKTWSEYLHKTTLCQEPNLQVDQYIRVGKGCLSYVITSGNESLVIDPARFYEVYVDEAKNNNLTIKHIVDSHCHADHVSGALKLAESTGATYYTMKADGVVTDYVALEDVKSIHFGEANVEVFTLKTPGHTPGSVCFLLNHKYLFSGDTLFINGLGRPDLGGMAELWAKDLYNSVQTQIKNLSDDILVLPSHCAEVHNDLNEAHYIGTLLKEIRAISPLLTLDDENEFISIVLGSINEKQPPHFEDIIAANRGTSAFTDEEIQEFEIGPNRCALQH